MNFLPNAEIQGMKKFRDYDQNQILLLPPSLQDWVPDDHPAKYIDEVV